MTVWINWARMNLDKYAWRGLRTRDGREFHICEDRGLFWVSGAQGPSTRDPGVLAEWLNGQGALFA